MVKARNPKLRLRVLAGVAGICLQGAADGQAERIVARINETYAGSAPEIHDSRGEWFNEGYIRRNHAMSLERDFTLIERYVDGDLAAADWHAARNDLPSPPYEMSADSVADCDQRRHGLDWKEHVATYRLTGIDPDSIDVAMTDPFGEVRHPTVSFGHLDDPYKMSEISCSSEEACERIAADLWKLVAIARASASPR